MKGKKGGLSEAYAAWADSVSRCCSYLTSCYSGGPRRGKDSPSFDVINEQPIRVQAPSTTKHYNSRTRTSAAAEAYSEKPQGRKSFANSIRDFSVRDLLNHSPLPPRPPTKDGRPRISSPTNFRHVHSHSLPHFSLDKDEEGGLGLGIGGSYAMVPSPRERPPSFLPLPGIKTGLSPILPYFDRVVTPPPAAMLRDGEAFDLKRSRSSLSFHVPRRKTGLDSHPCTPQMTTPQKGTPQKPSDDGAVFDDTPPPPQVPPRSGARTRARAYTAPAEVETIKERIAEALLEKERLQELIDDVVERQSVYLGSRPSTAHSMTTQILANVEPMPVIPALPPMAPSFAERLTSPQPSPFTASPAHTTFPHHHLAPTNPPTAFPDLIPSPLQLQPFQSHPPTPPRSRASNHSQSPPPLQLQPPLPLVLRPPLRKKKSFSRVSTWLFPEGKHGRGVSVDSVTNAPRPVQAGDGFYQCMSPVETAASSSAPRWGGQGTRMSVDTVATWESDEGETLPTTLSTGCNSPCVRLDRVGTFGEKVGRGKTVGVAF